MSRLVLFASLCAVVVGATAACGLQKGGALQEEPDTSIIDSGKPEVVADVQPDAPACDPKACPADQYCTATGCDYLSSCEAILAADKTATSRPYAIRTKPMKAPETEVVYCLMNLAEAPGAWMLFARTDVLATGPFGWTSPQADLNATPAKYVFDLKKSPGLAHGLIASRASKLDVDPNGPVIAFDFPTPFPGALGGSNIATSNLKVLRKAQACASVTPPTALQQMGLTDATDRFFFGEVANEVGVGIFANGFRSTTTGCGADQNLGTTGSPAAQVLLFVQFTP